TPNEIVDILLILGECNRNYRRASRRYAELYPNRRHPSAQQMINISKLLAILGMVHFNPHVSTR
ncbi:hypothetical protein ALC60_13736, partial [Trachymyrmex zeteki]